MTYSLARGPRRSPCETLPAPKEAGSSQLAHHSHRNDHEDIVVGTAIVAIEDADITIRDPVNAIKDPVNAIKDAVNAIKDPVNAIKDAVIAIENAVVSTRFGEFLPKLVERLPD